MELWIVNLTNKRSIDEEVSTIFPFTEQQQDRQNLISRSKMNEKFNRSKILATNKKKKFFGSNNKKGMHESYILRGTDPQGLNSFRISFTIIKPNKRPEDSFAQLNGILFLQDKPKTRNRNENENENGNENGNENENGNGKRKEIAHSERTNDNKKLKNPQLQTIIYKQDFDLKKVKFLKRKFQITIDKSKITCGAATGIISAKKNVSNSISEDQNNKQLFQPIYSESEIDKKKIKNENSIPLININLGDESESSQEFENEKNNKGGNKNINNQNDDSSEEDEKENGKKKRKDHGNEMTKKKDMPKSHSGSSVNSEKNEVNPNSPREDFLSFDLSFTVDQKPQLLVSNEILNEKIHLSPLKTILTIPYPKCEFGGGITYNHNKQTQNMDLDGWIGCQEHQWGKEYPKKQCFCVLNGGFSTDPNASCSFLETELKVGFQRKKLLLFVIRVSGIEIRLNSLYRGAKSYTNSRFQKEQFIWDFWTESQFDEYEGRIIAKRKDFVNMYTLDPKNSTRKIMVTPKAKIEIKVTNKKRNITELLDSNFGNFLEICVNEHDF
ncbi:hypothetical protein M0813_03050 [Anaeramoeba flamelloides]|uniref:Uncharacterized protein n=1 Tax=Anaeramoeba flamelloides TaxID=1746091 RepID=A0ABQ8YCF0_9EUKA|nr:hypothetical protein M0813_03050 [Anaeramoeba flamelloides]